MEVLLVLMYCVCSAGWMDIVDQWLHSSEEAAQALKALFGELPDLLPSCLNMLNTGSLTQ